MNVRHAFLAAFVATLPFSVDAPGDSTVRRGQTRIEVAGGAGQYSLISRGCEGQVISEVKHRLETGGLVVEHETPAGFVVGVRGGVARHEQDPVTIDDPYGGSVTTPAWSATNRYVNPFVAWEGGRAGFGAGWLEAQRPFVMGEDQLRQPSVTGHVRFGPREATTLTLRYMEQVPLEAEGHLTAELSVKPGRRVEIAPGIGVSGPYDGALIGVKGRFWLTPEAAALVRVSVGGHSQYNVLGGVSARWPARH